VNFGVLVVKNLISRNSNLGGISFCSCDFLRVSNAMGLGDMLVSTEDGRYD
jgi:hypothetical protein